MFFDILWIVFIIELAVGIVIGWLFASFYPWHKNSFEKIWSRETTQGLILSPLTGSVSDDMENKLQKVNANLDASREALARTEADLLRLKTENDTLAEKLAKEQTCREALEAQVGYYKNEVSKALTLSKTLQLQVTHFKNEAMKAQSSAKVGSSQADIDNA